MPGDRWFERLDMIGYSASSRCLSVDVAIPSSDRLPRSARGSEERLCADRQAETTDRRSPAIRRPSVGRACLPAGGSVRKTGHSAAAAPSGRRRCPRGILFSHLRPTVQHTTSRNVARNRRPTDRQCVWLNTVLSRQESRLLGNPILDGVLRGWARPVHFAQLPFLAWVDFTCARNGYT